MARLDHDDLAMIQRLSPLVGMDYPTNKAAKEVARSKRLKVYGNSTRAAVADNLDSITISRAGFFGNNVIQLVNGIYIAEQAGIPLVRHLFPAFAATSRSLPVRLKPRRSKSWQHEVGLQGKFFNRWNNGYLRTFSATDFVRILDTYLRPAFRWRTPTESGSLALNLRGGADIFEKTPPPDFYGQPPLSFYVAAASAALAAHDITRVVIVHQDTRNPVLPALSDWARTTGLPLAHVSSGPEGDAKALLSAEHIVMGCTTFTEALALLSDGLISIATCGRQHLFEQLDLCVPIRRRYEDDGGYEPTKSWTGNAAQRAQMIDFPAERLTMSETTSAHAARRREVAVPRTNLLDQIMQRF